MTTTGSRTVRGIAVVASPVAHSALEPLLDAYANRGSVDLIVVSEVPSVEALTDISSGTDAVLVVGSRRRSPRTVLSGPLLYPSDGRRVPVGWLPDVGERGLARFAESAARVQSRRGGTGSRSLALLGQRSRRYEDLSGRIGRVAAEGERPVRVYQWTADQLVRDAMLEGLGTGLAVGVYVGHGRPIGWVGYRGTRAHHLEDVKEPTGAILSLTCLTASRKRVGLSFAEALPLLGAAGAVFGSVTETLHTDNGRWAFRLARGLASTATTLGELVALAVPNPDEASSPYRILGDPLAPLLDARGAVERADALTSVSVLEHAS